jgi:hypothetical protein
MSMSLHNPEANRTSKFSQTSNNSMDLADVTSLGLLPQQYGKSVHANYLIHKQVSSVKRVSANREAHKQMRSRTEQYEEIGISSMGHFLAHRVLADTKIKVRCI